MCQVAAHHGPADVRISVDDGIDWDWAKWLPHRAEAPYTFAIAIAASEDELPACCTIVVRLASDLGDAGDFVACGMDEPVARRFARCLARFEDPEVEAGANLPVTVRLSELDDTNGVAIGVGTNGVIEIDLERDGPHSARGRYHRIRQERVAAHPRCRLGGEAHT